MRKTKSTKQHAAIEAHIDEALHECHQRLADMSAGQERHCNGRRAGNEALCRRGLRKFREGHVAFLNAAFSVGEYLLRAVDRSNIHSVRSMLDRPNLKFHRELRNTVDHLERLNYNVTFEIYQTVALTTPKLFPHPDVRVAISRGVADVEYELPRVGKGTMIYDRASLAVEDLVLLDRAMRELGIAENASVLYMAQRCYEDLAAFAQRPHETAQPRESSA